MKLLKFIKKIYITVLVRHFLKKNTSYCKGEVYLILGFIIPTEGRRSIQRNNNLYDPTDFTLNLKLF